MFAGTIWMERIRFKIVLWNISDLDKLIATCICSLGAKLWTASFLVSHKQARLSENTLLLFDELIRQTTAICNKPEDVAVIRLTLFMPLADEMILILPDIEDWIS